MTCMSTTPSRFWLSAISLEPPFNGRTDAAQKHEQAVAICDLLDNNRFAPVEHSGGPYRLHLELMDRRLVISVTTETGALVLCTSRSRHFAGCPRTTGSCARALPMVPRGCHPIVAIDMGRRAIHNEASALLRERLKSKVEIDRETARGCSR
ncbi:UPF0262 family protein [Sinorhizobium fredii]|uniref:Uncharacterized protein n=1 Tax=Rhizobium fredii TaxID=380 RepID=A0A2L0HBR7_RHIFR|nr:hypothetical protein NXT3_PB00283 [Sinorhizobium fredii]